MTRAPGPTGFVLTPQDSLDFACLSGDANPLHVDPVAARRLQFGGTVCHGVHLVLRTLDIALGDAAPQACVMALSAVFQQPVGTGTPVEVQVVHDTATGRIKLSGHAGGRPHFSMAVQLGSLPPTRLAPPDVLAVPPGAPREPGFPADSAVSSLRGRLPWHVDLALLARLFPALSRRPEGAALACDLMATTRLVGMEVPGLHSIYSEFKLQRRAAPAPDDFAYEVVQADARFRKVRMDVAGGLLQGTVTAFFREPPVAQATLREVAACTAPGCTTGQHALVVGGSRGLGELVAKMLLAGGAKVALSYASGRADAERIAAEAGEHGAACSIFALDLSEPLAPEAADRIAAAGFTHLYHFATPAIRKGGAAWNADLFGRYARFYAAGLHELARAAGRGPAPLHLFYPSTVFLDQPERGFAEYCSAKAAGEVVCDHLAGEGGRIVVHRPRLPRLRTDQNSGLMGAEGAAPLPVMAALLEPFCGWRPRAR